MQAWLADLQAEADIEGGNGDEGEELQPPPPVQATGELAQLQKKLADVKASLQPEALLSAAGPNRLAGYKWFQRAHALGAHSAAAEGAADDSDGGGSDAEDLSEEEAAGEKTAPGKIRTTRIQGIYEQLFTEHAVRPPNLVLFQGDDVRWIVLGSGRCTLRSAIM